MGKRALERPAGRVLRACREALASVPAGSTLVVAVSGGPDSLALLHGLHRAGSQRRTGEVKLHVAHLDHQLRPESGDDAAFVERCAAALDIPCTIGRADVMAYRQSARLSVEDAARQLRYAFLEGLAVKAGAAALALGHTADDQAETVFLHLARGSGLGGLRGMSMAEARSVNGRRLLYLRPLLGLRRADTVGACEEWGLTPLHDPSNESTRYTRNLVRAQVMPALRAVNRNVADALLRLSTSARRDLDFIEAEAARRAEGHVRVRPGRRPEDRRILVDRRWLLREPPALQHHIVRRAFALAAGTEADLEAAHTDALAALLGARAGASADLPRGTVAATTREHLVLAPATTDLCAAPPLPPAPLRLDCGETWYPSAGGWRVMVRRLHVGDAPPSDRWALVLPLEVAGRGLWLRPWRAGDRVGRSGGRGTRKVQDVLTDAGVPRWCRARVPMLFAGSPESSDALWVVGWRRGLARGESPGALVRVRPPDAWCWCLASE